MSTFTIAMWLKVEADSQEEAYKMSEEIQAQIIERVSYVNDTGEIDVGEQEE